MLFLFITVYSPTEPSRRPRRFSVVTSTLLTLMQMLMTKVRKRKKTRMKKAGTDPRNRLRGGWGGRVSLRSTSPVSWKVVTWPTKTMRFALQTCLRGSRCVCVCVFVNLCFSNFMLACIYSLSLYFEMDHTGRVADFVIRLVVTFHPC